MPSGGTLIGVVVEVVLHLEGVNVVVIGLSEVQVGVVRQALGVVVVEQRPQRGEEHRGGRGRGEQTRSAARAAPVLP